MSARNRYSRRKWQWYHGLALYAGANAATFALERLAKRSQTHVPEQEADKVYYRQQKRPAFAPPSWAFGPAWTLNAISLIWGGLRVLNMPRRTEGRRPFLALQTAFWLLYVAFTPLYFGLRSPILGALVTQLTLGVTAASEAVAVKQLHDKPTAFSQLSTLFWLVVASATAITTALWNRDPFLKQPARFEPDNSWLKANRPTPAKVSAN